MYIEQHAALHIVGARYSSTHHSAVLYYGAVRRYMCYALHYYSGAGVLYVCTCYLYHDHDHEHCAPMSACC